MHPRPQPGQTVIVLQQQQSQGHHATPAELVAFGGALVLALGQFVAFTNAYNALNHQNPDIAAAEAWLMGGIAAGVAAVAFIAWAAVQRKAHPVYVAVGGILGLVSGFSLPSSISFGFLGGLGWLFIEAFLLGVLLIPLIVFLVLVFGPRQREAWGLGTAVILFHVLSYTVLVAFMLANIDRLAQEAAEANEPTSATAAAPLVMILMMGAALAWRRVRGFPTAPAKSATVPKVRVKAVPARRAAPRRASGPRTRPRRA